MYFLLIKIKDIIQLIIHLIVHKNIIQAIVVGQKAMMIGR